MTQKQIKDWVSQQDWTLRDAEIARLTGLSQTVVRNRRMKAGIAKGSVSKRKSKWDDVDWSRSDIEIAHDRCVTRQCVNAYRQKNAK
jgi:hypothetical protein